MATLARRKTRARANDSSSDGGSDIQSGLIWSVGLHSALILAILIKSVVFPGNPVSYVPTLRVDIVGLPDLLKKDLSKVTPAPPAEDLSKALKEATKDAKEIKPIKVPKNIEPAQPDEMVLKPKEHVEKPDAREKRMKSALARIKALSKISSETIEKRSPLIKGNMISKGTSLSGDAKEAAQASYYDLLRDKLQQNWALPVWIARQNLSAQVQIFVDGRGMVRGMKFIKVSGNAQFDEAVKRTLTDSQPFPRPPEGLSASMLSDGILVGFPL